MLSLPPTQVPEMDRPLQAIRLPVGSEVAVSIVLDPLSIWRLGIGLLADGDDTINSWMLSGALLMVVAVVGVSLVSDATGTGASFVVASSCWKLSFASLWPGAFTLTAKMWCCAFNCRFQPDRSPPTFTTGVRINPLTCLKLLTHAF